VESHHDLIYLFEHDLFGKPVSTFPDHALMAAGGLVHDRAVLDALDNFRPQRLEQIVWRVARKGRDPLRGAIANGRWNAIGEMEVLYTSFERDGALAEVGYRLSLEPVWPSRIEHQVHQLTIKADRALRIDALAQLEKLGVDIAKYESFEYGMTQAIAAAAHFLQFDALIVPSARHTATNLVLFLDQIQTPPELKSSEEVDWSQWRARRRR
jgi:RES domain-containing protein